MTQQATELFEVEFKAYPTSQHSAFERFKIGLLVLWVYATDEEHAVKVAKTFAVFLPYQLGPGKIFPVDGQENLAAWQIDCAVAASHIGINLAFQGYATEEAFKAAIGPYWPYLVPPLTECNS